MTLGMSTIHERIHPKWLIPNKYNARMLALLKNVRTIASDIEREHHLDCRICFNSSTFLDANAKLLPLRAFKLIMGKGDT